MKRLKSFLLSIILLCSVQSYAQIGIQSMEISASTVNVGDTVQITLGIRNYNFSAAYNPTAYPMFVSVGLPAASKILTYASTSLFGTGASAFSSITTYDSFNFTFDLIGSIPPVISGDNVRYVTFKLIAANPNPPGSAPQFLVQLQYPYGDMPGTNPALQSAMSPVFTVNALGATINGTVNKTSYVAATPIYAVLVDDLNKVKKTNLVSGSGSAATYSFTDVPNGNYHVVLIAASTAPAEGTTITGPSSNLGSDYTVIRKLKNK